MRLGQAGHVTLHELDALLASLRVKRRDGVFTVVELDEAPPDVDVEASIKEDEGTSYVLRWADAVACGLDPEFRFAWLTLDVESGLESIGLTAAVAGALAENDIACNVLAAFHHDHLLVPERDWSRAAAVLADLAARHQVV